MSTDNLTVMKALTQKMSWLEQNQKVLAENIANADTPGYAARELKPIDFKSMLQATTSRIPIARTGDGATAAVSTGVKATNPLHMSTGGTTSAQLPKNEKSREIYEAAPDGNSVILEEQLLKMNESFADHRLITNLYQKNIDMLKMSTKSQ